MKKFLTSILVAAVAALIALCGCTGPAGADGRDGQDGKDVSIYEIYESVKSIEGNEDITFEEFLLEYLNYTNEELDNLSGVRSKINYSLMAGVSILTRFAYTSSVQTWAGLRPVTGYKVFSGSGVIISLDKESGDALVVTNCHVVYDDSSDEVFCEDIRLYLYGQDAMDLNYVINQDYSITDDDNYRIDAEIIGASVTYDIALLKVTDSSVLKRSDAVAASFTEDDDVYVGDPVYAVGNASGEGLSASSGIISKDSEYISLNLSTVNEASSGTYRVIRTDAAINHGNSGGALYNADGEIVAIVNSKDDETGVDNMGYALPASYVRRLVALMYEEYLENGVPSGYGFDKALMNIVTELVDTYSVLDPVTGLAEIIESVKITEVSGSPAKNCLQVGDYIKGIKITDAAGNVKEDVTVTRRYHINDTLFSVRKGDRVIVTVLRNDVFSGSYKTVEVEMDFNKDSYFVHYD